MPDNNREGYDWWPQPGVRQMFACDTCGSLVADTDQHDRYHEALARMETIVVALQREAQ